MNHAITALPIFKRKTFTGRSDKYAATAIRSRLAPALDSVAPVDVAGSVLSEAYVQDATTRLAAYTRFRRYYTGKHFAVMYEGGKLKVPFNYCRSVVDKRAAWAVGRDFRFSPPKGNELVSELLRKVWEANGGRSLIRKSTVTGMTTGDVFWYFTVRKTDRAKKELPRNKWSVKITPINPTYCHPVWSEDDPSVMSAFMMQFPIQTNVGSDLCSVVMTAETVKFYKNEVLDKELPNPLGMIPVVHLPFNNNTDHLFGVSALEDVAPLNDAYNETMMSIRRIINYHGEPTTLVYGARLSQMERGANKVWSNLPSPDLCKVENLQLEGNLEAIYKQLDYLERHIFRSGRIPKIAFDSDGIGTSNTSGIAMQAMYQPLIEASWEAQEALSIAMRQGNQLIAKIHATYFGENLATLADDVDALYNMEMDVVFNSLLPKDEQMEIDNATKKVAAGIWSRAEAARRLSSVQDSEKLALELAADASYELAMAAEKQNALNGRPINMASVFLPSIFLNEDLIDIASQFKEPSEVLRDGTEPGKPDA